MFAKLSISKHKEPELTSLPVEVIMIFTMNVQRKHSHKRKAENRNGIVMCIMTLVKDVRERMKVHFNH